MCEHCSQKLESNLRNSLFSFVDVCACSVSTLELRRHSSCGFWIVQKKNFHSRCSGIILVSVLLIKQEEIGGVLGKFSNGLMFLRLRKFIVTDFVSLMFLSARFVELILTHLYHQHQRM